MMRHAFAGLIMAVATQVASAEYLLLVDPGRFNAAEASRGSGLDGEPVDPRAVANACRSAGRLGPAAFDPADASCRPIGTVAGLVGALSGLTVEGTDITVTATLNGGGVVAVETRRRVACVPGNCRRLVFDGVAYPVGSIGSTPPPPPAAPAITLMAVDPVSLAQGATATVSWSASGVGTCTLADSGTGQSQTVAASGNSNFTPAVDTAWTLTCSGAGGSTFAQAVAEVIPPAQAPEIVLFAPTLKEVVAGAGTSLRWETRLAEACTLADGSGATTVPLNAIYPVTVNANTTYRLECTSAEGSVARTATIAATQAPTPPEIVTFGVSPTTILRGANVIASWEVSDTESCLLSDPVQRLAWRVKPAGSLKLVPAASTSYTLDCRNANGSDRASRSVTVTDSGSAIRMTSFNLKPYGASGRKGEAAGPVRLARPGLLQVDWSTTAARACLVGSDGQSGAFSVPVNGSYVLWVDETTSLQANCASREGEAQAFGQVEVFGEAVFFGDFEG